MSERAILSLLLACATLAAPVQGQDLAQLKRREAELTARLAQLHAEASASTEGWFADQRRAVVASGPLRVAYPGAAISNVGDRAISLLDLQRQRFGAAIDSLLTDTLFLGVGDTIGTWSGRAVWRLGGLQGEQDVGVARTSGAAWIAMVTGAALQQWSQDLLDPALRSWLGAIDARATVATLRDPLVRDLVSSPSSRARRCLNGAVDDCRLLLELDEGRTPLLSAYDVADLPALFDRMDLSIWMRGRVNCTGKRDPAACADLVRQGLVLPPHPVSARARQSLFAYALASGGEGAWLRLHRSQGLSVAAQLRAAAARPVDSLLVSWQHDLRAGRRTTTAGLAPSLLLTLAWGVVTALFFAWRYRWRHV